MGRCSTKWVLAILVALGAAAEAADGGSGFWVLEEHPYFDPIQAEPRSAAIKIAFPARSDEFAFMREAGSRLIWDISVGKELPIVGWSTQDDGGELGKGKWGIGFWGVVGFHMAEDFKDESSPIINTDYRFGGALKAQRAFADQRYLGARLYLGHESTHLGDEFSLAAQRLHPDFERINVSWEYWEYAVSWEMSTGQGDTGFLTLRHGMHGLIDPDKGYYSADPAETNGRVVPGSKRHLEPYLGLEYQRMGGIRDSRWRPFLSFHASPRIVLDYDKASRDVEEERQWSFNLMAGFRVSGDFDRLDFGVPYLYLRYYHGVNPHGQFRNQRDYDLVGLGLTFDI